MLLILLLLTYLTKKVSYTICKPNENNLLDKLKFKVVLLHHPENSKCSFLEAYRAGFGYVGQRL